jgi:hypothetical protein
MNASERGNVNPTNALFLMVGVVVVAVAVTDALKTKYADTPHKDCIENGTAIIEGKRYICVPYEVQEAALPE